MFCYRDTLCSKPPCCSYRPCASLPLQLRSRTEQMAVLEARLAAQSSGVDDARQALAVAEAERNRAVADARVAEQLRAAA